MSHGYRLPGFATAALVVFGLTACGPPAPRHPTSPHPRRSARVDPLQLNLGRAGRPQGHVQLRQGDLLDTDRDRKLTWDALSKRLARARVIFVGERHDHRGHHRIQATVIQRLARQSSASRPLHIGLEMLYRNHGEAVLRNWVAGALAEKTFLQQVRWRQQWGMDFRYYRPIFLASKRHKLPVYGLNVPLRIARTVGRRGLSALSSDVRATLPRLHLRFPRHRQVFRALLGLPPKPKPRRRSHHRSPHGHGHRHHGFMARLFTAQVLRDEVMAAEIVTILERAGPRSRMVVIVGNGHLFYHTGVNARLRRLRPRWPQATVICVSAGSTGRRVSRGLGDYLVGTERHGPGQRYPRPSR